MSMSDRVTSDCGIDSARSATESDNPPDQHCTQIRNCHEDPLRGHHRPLPVRRRDLVFADVPARAARARARGLLHRGHRRVCLRPRAEHARHRSRLRHGLHPQRARAVRPRRSLVVRQLRRQLSRPERRGCPPVLRPAPISSSICPAASWFWRDEYARIPRKVFIDSDPAFTQLAIAKAEPWYVQFFEQFDHLFTFGANIGTPASPIPTGAFTWHKTWQPITLDDWLTTAFDQVTPRDRFTSVMTWQIESFADVGGNKDQEFVKFVDLPSKTPQRLENLCLPRHGRLALFLSLPRRSLPARWRRISRWRAWRRRA